MFNRLRQVRNFWLVRLGRIRSARGVEARRAPVRMIASALPLLGLALLVVSSPALAQSRNRVDLDDMMIKGELHNDDRLMILSRQKNELKNFVKFRTNFREEMLQELPIPKPKLKL